MISYTNETSKIIQPSKNNENSIANPINPLIKINSLNEQNEIKNQNNLNAKSSIHLPNNYNKNNKNNNNKFNSNECNILSSNDFNSTNFFFNKKNNKSFCIFIISLTLQFSLALTSTSSPSAASQFESDLNSLSETMQKLKSNIRLKFQKRCNQSEKCFQFFSECSSFLPNLSCTNFEDLRCNDSKNGNMLEASYDYAVLRLHHQSGSFHYEKAEAEQATQELSCALSDDNLKADLKTVAKNFPFTKFQLVAAAYSRLLLSYPARQICLENDVKKNSGQSQQFCFGALGAKNVFLLLDMNESVKRAEKSVLQSVLGFEEVYDTLVEMDSLVLGLFEKGKVMFLNGNGDKVKSAVFFSAGESAMNKKNLIEKIKGFYKLNETVNGVGNFSNSTSAAVSDKDYESKSYQVALEEVYKKIAEIENLRNNNKLNENNSTDTSYNNNFTLNFYAKNLVFLITDSIQIKSEATGNLISKTFEFAKIKNSVFYQNTNKPFFILYGVGDLNENSIDFLRGFSCELKGIYFIANSGAERLSNYCAYLSLNNISEEILIRGKYIDVNTGDYMYSLVMPVFENNPNLISNNNNLNSSNIYFANFLAYVYSVDLNLKEIESKYGLSFNSRGSAKADFFSKSGDSVNEILDRKVQETLKSFYSKVTKSSIFNNDCVLSVFRNDSKCSAVNQACLNLLNPKNNNSINNNNINNNNDNSTLIKIEDLKIQKQNFLTHALCANKKTFYANNQILKREDNSIQIKIEQYIPPPCNCKTFSITNIILICIGFAFLIALLALLVLFFKKKNYCLKKKKLNSEAEPEAQVEQPDVHIVYNNTENNHKSYSNNKIQIGDASQSSNRNHNVNVINNKDNINNKKNVNNALNLKRNSNFEKLDLQPIKSESHSDSNAFQSSGGSNSCLEEERKEDDFISEPNIEINFDTSFDNKANGKKKEKKRNPSVIFGKQE